MISVVKTTDLLFILYYDNCVKSKEISKEVIGNDKKDNQN